MNFIHERADIPLSIVPTFLSSGLPLFTTGIIYVNWACWFCVPVLCMPEDGCLSLKQVGEFHMCELVTVLYDLYSLVGVCGWLCLL
jgi:hypothetical protein